jgi:hypothetical protein
MILDLLLWVSVVGRFGPREVLYPILERFCTPLVETGPINPPPLEM